MLILGDLNARTSLAVEGFSSKYRYKYYTILGMERGSDWCESFELANSRLFISFNNLTLKQNYGMNVLAKFLYGEGRLPTAMHFYENYCV